MWIIRYFCPILTTFCIARKDFHNRFQYQISHKSLEWETRWWHSDRRTDITKCIGAFRANTCNVFWSVMRPVPQRWPALQWRNWHRTRTLQHSLPLQIRSVISHNTFPPLNSILNKWNTFHTFTDYCCDFKFHIVFALQSIRYFLQSPLWMMYQDSLPRLFITTTAYSYIAVQYHAMDE